MLLDHRTYTVKPGTMAKHLKIYEEKGKAPQMRHLGAPLAYMVAESGELNTYVHIWMYEDAADRARKRAAMMADPDWIGYLEASAAAGYLIKQENKLMTPVPFYPIKT
jgi:hypothetical protein